MLLVLHGAKKNVGDLPTREHGLVLPCHARLAGSRRLLEGMRIMCLLRTRNPHGGRYCVFIVGCAPMVERASRRRPRSGRWRPLHPRSASSSSIPHTISLALPSAAMRIYTSATACTRMCPSSVSIARACWPRWGRGVGQAVTLGDRHRLHAAALGLIASIDSALSAKEREGLVSLPRVIEEIELRRETIRQLPTGAR
jgi:hypothetical protein